MKPSTQQPQTTQSYSDQLLSIPTKICDGIFMADEYIAQDIEWLQMNQVTHVINCAGKHCKNSPKLTGVNFLTYEWSENNIQNIIEQNVIGAAISFIQQAKKQCGSVLVHCHQSESRPFCILASYLMIRYQWNLFKTLEFLNSRKQDIELEPAFFEQLTSLHQKLQQKGLIKSRTWTREDYMPDQEIILTNTFLNSRKRHPESQKQGLPRNQANSRKSQTKNKKINWKQSMSQIHVYYPMTALIELNPKNNNPQPNTIKQKQNQKPFRDSVSSKYVEQENDKNSSINQKQAQLKAITETNVTKRWAELRQAWTKEKQNNHELQNQPQPQNARKSEKPLNNVSNTFVAQQKQQKISDRIQQKLNIIKNGYDTSKSASNDMMKRRDHTPITGKKIKSTSMGQKGDQMRKEPEQTNQRISLIQKRNNNMPQSNDSTSSNESNKQNERPHVYEFNRNPSSSTNKQQQQAPSKFLKPNTSSNQAKQNFSINQTRQSNQYPNQQQSHPASNNSMIVSQKQMGNKSVLIVKPNQFGCISNNNDSANLSQSRNSKRKIYDHDNKENRFSLNKENGIMRDSNIADISQMRNSKVSNFFRVDPNLTSKGQEIDRTTKRPDSSIIGNPRISQSLQGNKTTTSLTKKGSSSSSVMTKMRSSSTRVSRKQQIPSSNTSISKNYSYTGKGKWKF